MMDDRPTQRTIICCQFLDILTFRIVRGRFDLDVYTFYDERVGCSFFSWIVYTVVQDMTDGIPPSYLHRALRRVLTDQGLEREVFAFETNRTNRFVT